MKIFIGADHRGFLLKKKIIRLLEEQGYSVEDLGSYEEGVICDYPKIAYQVASSVAGNKDSRGILACMTGIGHSIAANKVPGAYAALCYNKRAAELSRQHNNSNVLVLGAKFIRRQDMKGILLTWMKTPFEGGRHQRRVNQIKNIERKVLCR